MQAQKNKVNIIKWYTSPLPEEKQQNRCNKNTSIKKEYKELEILTSIPTQDIKLCNNLLTVHSCMPMNTSEDILSQITNFYLQISTP